MHNTLENEVTRSITSRDEQQDGQEEQERQGTSGQETQPIDTIHIHYFPDAIVILKEENGAAPKDDIIAAPLGETKQPPVFLAYAACAFYLFLVLSCIAFQLSCVFNPPAATISILTTQTGISTYATISIPAHPVPPFSFTQTVTTQTTGHGHQRATQARGSVTFYNSLTQPQTISAGTLLIGTDHEQVVTEQTAYIPAGTLDTNGHATVSGRALNSGTEGNIKAGDIYGACCRVFIQVVNSAFSGGQNERDYQAVAQGDVATAVTTLTSRFQHTMQIYLAAHVSHDGTLLTPIPCTTTLRSNHPIGAEAAQVTVLLQKICTPLSYSTSNLHREALSVLTQAAHNRLGGDYALFGNFSTRITRAAIRQQTLLLSVVSSGSWARVFNMGYLASLLAGKTPEEAQHMLQREPGVTRSGIQLAGFTDRIPKNPDRIHFVFLYEAVQNFSRTSP
jgi:hypothetical protein